MLLSTVNLCVTARPCSCSQAVGTTIPGVQTCSHRALNMNSCLELPSWQWAGEFLLLSAGEDWRAATLQVCAPWHGCEFWRWPPGDCVTLDSIRVSACSIGFSHWCWALSKGSSTAPVVLLGILMPWATHARMPVCPQTLGSPSPSWSHTGSSSSHAALCEAGWHPKLRHLRTCSMSPCSLAHVHSMPCSHLQALLGFFGDSRSAR